MMMIIWLAAFVVFAIFEAATVQLVSIWFAAGSLAALIAALFHCPLYVQLSVFLVVSILTLLLTRPIIKSRFAARFSPTNADRIIGSDCRVTEDINNLSATGAVSVMGNTWTARSKNGEIIKAGTIVRAVAIDGVKLIVVPAEQQDK